MGHKARLFLKKLMTLFGAPTKITLVYLFIAATWILVSDRLLESMVDSPAELTRLQTFKGWFFVISTALLLYFLIRRDTQRREKAAEDLRESEERLQLAFLHTDQGIWDWDFASDKVFFSEKWASMLGYHQDEIEGKYQSWEKLVHPDDLPHVLHELQNHLDGKTEFYSSEHRLRTRSGEWKWILDMGRVVRRDSDNRPLRMIGTHRDITTQKGALDALKENQRILATLLHNLPGMAYRCRNAPDWPMEYVSEGCLGLTGYPAARLMPGGGIEYASLIHPEDRERVWEEVQEAVAADRPFQLTYRILTATGEERWVWEKGQAVATTSDEAFLEGFITDVTKRIRAQEALAVRNMQYESFIENSLVGIWKMEFPQPIPTTLPPREIARQILDTGFFTECNYALLRMYGMTSKKEWLGRTAAEMVFDWDEAIDRLERVAINDFKAELVDNREKDPRGKVHYFRNSYFGYVHKSELLWMWDIQVDITDQKRMEEQYLQSQKMESVGKLAGGIAHDFNNLMTVVTGFSELIEHQLDDREELLHSIHAIREAGERAATLTRQLLAFSRKQLIQPRITSLNVLIENIAKLIKRLIGEDIELELDLAADPATSLVDPGQIEQVIMNLAVNARDALPAGGRIRIASHSIRLEDTFIGPQSNIPAGNYVVLTVSDNGMGISADVREHIFEPFFTTKGIEQGTGLGLATVYGIVRQSNGHILVESEPDQGTTFSVYLPTTSGEDKSAPASPGLAIMPGGTETLLLLEDEDSLRRLIHRILSSNGYQVLVADNAKAAIELMDKHSGNVHLLITDVVMPDLSGPEVAKACTAIVNDLKVLYISGYATDTIARHGIPEAGFSLLHKPFTTRELLVKVRNVLDVDSHPTS